MNSEVLQRVLYQFPALEQETVAKIIPVTHGHINRSFKVITSNRSLFVQQINAQLFAEVDRLSRQIVSVTQELADYYAGNDLPYLSLQYYNTSAGAAYTTVDQDHFRITDFLLDMQVHQRPSNEGMVMSAAMAFAHFVKGLDTISLHDAYQPITRFHDLAYRYYQLNIAKNAYPGGQSLAELFRICDHLYDGLRPLITALQDGLIRTRWVHNDTKFNNVLFDSQSKARCIVDLDTVMPGSILFDVGDALRTIGTNLAEDDSRKDELSINRGYVDSFISGYLEVLGDQMTDTELTYLRQSSVYMSTIMGFRFLTDYISGSKYYQIDYPNHNLDRATNQLYLALSFLAIQ
jgi:N-acetylhexosamine 1-kinase